MTPLVNISNRHYYLPLGPSGDYGALRVLYQRPEASLKQYTGKKQRNIDRVIARTRLSPPTVQGDTAYPVDDCSMVDGDPHYSLRDQTHYRQTRRTIDNLPDIEMDTLRESAVYLPSSLRPLCLKFLHEGNGHPGSRRTRASVASKYYWLNMNSDIDAHVARCIHCARRKSDTATKATLPIGRHPIPTRPMQHVHTDLITELPKSKRGNRHISVTIDSLTGYMHATALPDRKADTVAEAWINDIMLHFGCPEVITTDNGVEYTNNLMRAVNALLHIRHHFTVPYNPQSNGKVEKRNGTLMATLTQFANANQDDWDIYLPVATWSYNTTVNSATGYTPFRAVFGREARSPSDSWIEDFQQRYCRGLDDLVSRMTQNLRDIWWDITKRTYIIHQREDHDRPDNPHQRPFRPYRRGEQFFFKSVPRRNFKSLEDEQLYKISAKLQYRFSGPHVVTEVISPVVYRVRIDGREKIIHANRMKRDPRKLPPLAFSATVTDNLPPHDGPSYCINEPLCATSDHMLTHGMLPMELDHLCAQHVNRQGAYTFTNPAPPMQPPLLSRRDYPTETAFRQAIQQGRHDHSKLWTQYQLNLDLIHRADLSVTSPPLVVRSGIIELSLEPLV